MRQNNQFTAYSLRLVEENLMPITDLIKRYIMCKNCKDDRSLRTILAKIKKNDDYIESIIEKGNKKGEFTTEELDLIDTLTAEILELEESLKNL